MLLFAGPSSLPPQNIIKKVSGQKFVYKFVSQPDASLPEGARGADDGLRRDGADPGTGQSNTLGGGGSTCSPKSLPQRSSPSGAQRSSRNDYMKSGLYSTFTIQSLQASPGSRPIKSEVMLQQDSAPKLDRKSREVCVLESKGPLPLGGAVDSGLQVIVTQPSPCPTPALSPQMPVNAANQSQNPPVPPLSDPPPPIYLTRISDPSSLTPLLPLGAVGGAMSPAPPPHLPMGTQGPQQDDCGGVASQGAFPGHPHPPPPPPHPAHPSPVFVIINPTPSLPPPPPSQQQQQPSPPAVPAAPPAAPPTLAAPPNVALPSPTVIPSPPPRPSPPPIVIKEENLPSEEELLEMVSLEEKQREEVPQLICGPAEPDTPLTIVESPPPACVEPGVRGQQPASAGECKDTPTDPVAPPPPVTTSTASTPSAAAVSVTDAAPPKPKKPRGLELPSSPSLPPGLSLDKVNAAVNSLLAPGASTNTLTPTVITSHALTPVLLTPSPLPSTIHFWSTLSPIAPRSPAKLSFQFPSNGSSQIHIPALSVDGLSTPVVLSPGPHKP